MNLQGSLTKWSGPVNCNPASEAKDRPSKSETRKKRTVDNRHSCTKGNLPQQEFQDDSRNRGLRQVSEEIGEMHHLTARGGRGAGQKSISKTTCSRPGDDTFVTHPGGAVMSPSPCPALRLLHVVNGQASQRADSNRQSTFIRVKARRMVGFDFRRIGIPRRDAEKKVQSRYFFLV